MSIKFNILSLACLLGFANVVPANQPPNVPNLYANGAASTLLSVTKLNATEKTAYALFEASMEVAEGLIHATSCPAAAGKYTFNVLANGAIADPKNNEIRIASPGKSVESLFLRANLDTQSELRGQRIRVEQFGNGSLGGTEIAKYASAALFNVEGSIMTSESSVNVRGLNGAEDNFQSKMTKNFYLDLTTSANHVYDWGQQSLSKNDFPIEIYWLRSKLYRNNGNVERTTFVKDRLIGPTPCRILIESSRPNNQNSIALNGTLTISTEIPTEPAADFFAKSSISH
jgi:hypothetical protein